jgi:hypothetical protein
MLRWRSAARSVRRRFASRLETGLKRPVIFRDGNFQAVIAQLGVWVAAEQKTHTSPPSCIIDTGIARVAQRPEFASYDKIRQREGISAEHVDVFEPEG